MKRKKRTRELSNAMNEIQRQTTEKTHKDKSKYSRKKYKQLKDNTEG